MSEDQVFGGWETQQALDRDVEMRCYEAERKAHIETKVELMRIEDAVYQRTLESAVNRQQKIELDECMESFAYIEKRLEATETRLRELEDANQKLRELYYTERKDLAQFREYADTYYPDLWDCFQNSRERQEEARLQKRLADRIRENGGEAMG